MKEYIKKKDTNPVILFFGFFCISDFLFYNALYVEIDL